MSKEPLVSIGQLTNQTKLSIRTIRFYEEKNILSPIRDKNNNRLYDDQEQHWANFVRYLRDSGVSLASIQQYHQLILQGDETLEDRIAILENQKQVINDEIEYKYDQIKQINHKLAKYRSGKKGYL